MSRKTWLNIALLLCFLGMAAIIAYADTVDHHGFQVSTEATYTECLSCHDGVLAPAVSVCLGTICTFQDSHPVNKYYPPPDRMREFAPATVAEMAGVKFVDGRIDCISCHELTATDRYYLRITNWKSRLCLACHLR
jgi:hypothetical protein